MNYEKRLRRLNVNGTPHYTGDKSKYILGFEGDVFGIIREADEECDRVNSLISEKNKELEAKDELIAELKEKNKSMTKHVDAQNILIKHQKKRLLTNKE